MLIMGMQQPEPKQTISNLQYCSECDALRMATKIKVKQENKTERKIKQTHGIE